MKWVYDITGAEIIIKDMPVYDAANIAAGELLMKGTTDPDSGNDEGISFVTAYSATPANTAIDALGISLEAKTTSSSPSVASAYSTTTGPCYAKCIINPFAVYEVEHSLAAADDVAITSTATTTVTIPSLSDDIDGSWVYFPLTATGVKGSLRLLVAAAAGSATMDSALTVDGTAADTAVIITPYTRYANNLTADATKIASGACDAINGATNIRVIQTMVDRGAGIEIMQPQVHYAINNLDNCNGGIGPHFYYHIVLKDHVFGVQE